MTTNFFSPLSFAAVFGSGIRDPGSGMGSVSGINIPDPLHWEIPCYHIWLQKFSTCIFYLYGSGHQIFGLNAFDSDLDSANILDPDTLNETTLVSIHTTQSFVIYRGRRFLIIMDQNIFIFWLSYSNIFFSFPLQFYLLFVYLCTVVISHDTDRAP